MPLYIGVGDVHKAHDCMNRSKAVDILDRRQISRATIAFWFAQIRCTRETTNLGDLWSAAFKRTAGIYQVANEATTVFNICLHDILASVLGPYQRSLAQDPSCIALDTTGGLCLFPKTPVCKAIILQTNNRWHIVLHRPMRVLGCKTWVETHIALYRCILRRTLFSQMPI